MRDCSQMQLNYWGSAPDNVKISLLNDLARGDVRPTKIADIMTRHSTPTAASCEMMMNEEVLTVLADCISTKDFVMRECVGPDPTFGPIADHYVHVHAPSVVCKEWARKFGRTEGVKRIDNDARLMEFRMSEAPIVFEKHLVFPCWNFYVSPQDIANIDAVLRAVGPYTVQLRLSRKSVTWWSSSKLQWHWQVRELLPTSSNDWPHDLPSDYEGTYHRMCLHLEIQKPQDPRKAEKAAKAIKEVSSFPKSKQRLLIVPSQVDCVAVPSIHDNAVRLLTAAEYKELYDGRETPVISWQRVR